MTCDEVEVSLSAWLDDELEPTESVAVAAHLQTCERCRRQSNVLRSARQIFRTLAPAINSDSRPSVPRRYYAPVVALVAAVTMLLLAVRMPETPAPRFAEGPARSVENGRALNLPNGRAATVSPDSMVDPALDCNVNDPGPNCELELPAAPCSSALDCSAPGP